MKILFRILCWFGIHPQTEKGFIHEDFVDRQFNPCKHCGRYVWHD